MASHVRDLTGRSYGRLAVIRFQDIRSGHARFACLCDCGRITIVRGSKLRDGSTVSCGCWRREQMDAGRERAHALGVKRPGSGFAKKKRARGRGRPRLYTGTAAERHVQAQQSYRARRANFINAAGMRFR